jgi:hypothetical protein
MQQATPAEEIRVLEIREGDYALVRRSAIDLTRFRYDAWIPTDSGLLAYDDVLAHDGRLWGRLGTEVEHAPLPPLPAFGHEHEPVPPTFVEPIPMWRDSSYDRAYGFIEQAFPAAATGRRSEGVITSR